MSQSMTQRLKVCYWGVLYRIARCGLYVDYVKLRLAKFWGVKGEGVVKIAGSIVHYGDLDQLIKLFSEIYLRRCYFFNSGANPTIIDGGANIGLATLFFKAQYPNARVAAFEPNPQTFTYLKKNIEANELADVEIHNAALAEQDGATTLYCSGDMVAGDIGVSTIKQHVEYFHGGQSMSSITVPCERLSKYITSDIDMLKLDVEGSEAKVVAELGTRMKRIKNVVMEYHYHATYSDNPLSVIVSVMEQTGHLYQISGTGGRKLSQEETYLIRSVRQ